MCTFVGGGCSVSVCPSRQPLGALAQTLALRALRWKTAKGMAPIMAPSMLEDAKALVAPRGEAKGRYKVARDKIQSQPTSTNNHIEILMMEYRTFRFEAMDHRTVLAQVKAPAPEEVLSKARVRKEVLDAQVLIMDEGVAELMAPEACAYVLLHAVTVMGHLVDDTLNTDKGQADVYDLRRAVAALEGMA